MSAPPLLCATWPHFAAELAAALDGEQQLKDQVKRLRVIETCDCGDDFCQSFHTAPKPSGAYGEGHRTIDLRAPWPGYLVLDVVDEEIVHVEVLHRHPLA